MEITDYFNILLLLGSTLSLIMAVFLWIHPSKLFANYVLGTMNFLWFVVVFVFAMQSKEFYLKFPHLLKIVSVIPLALFPLLYIYIKAYLTGYNWTYKSFFIHFTPAVAYVFAISPFYFQTADAKRVIIQSGNFPEYLFFVSKVFDLIIIIQGIIYTALSMQLILAYQKIVKSKQSEYYKQIIDWLKFFVISYVLLWAVGTVGAVFSMLDISVPFNLFRAFYLGLTVLTVGIGAFALKHPHILSVRFKNDGQIINNKEIILDKEADANDNVKDMRLILDYLEKEKAYLKNDLSLNDITEATGVPKHRISAIFNHELGKNFYEILNEYRTREAIRLMNEGKHMNFTLTYIAEMAGFNSRATFNRIFKKITNQTPSEFIRTKYINDDLDN